MLTLNPGLIESLDAGRLVVVADARRGASVRAAHAQRQIREGRRVWRTPAIATFGSWLERELDIALATGVELPRRLSAAEAWVHWRLSAEESARAADVEPTDALVDALQRAAGLAQSWCVPQQALKRTADRESSWLARTMQAFEARCASLGAEAVPQLVERLQHVPATRVTLAGFVAVTPRERSWIARWQAAGADIRRLEGPSHRASSAITRAADPAAELVAAAEWARGRLLQDPKRHLLVVLPKLAAGRDAAARCFSRSLGEQAFGFDTSATLADEPFVRHALASLRLITGWLEFDEFSSWLRSPWSGAPPSATRARLDAWLRERLGLRVSRADLLQALSAVQEAELAAGARELRARLERAALAFEAAPARASIWVERWSGALRALDIPGDRPRPGRSDPYLRFLQTLDELAMADGVLGELSAVQALQWLVRIVRRAGAVVAEAASAVTLTDSLADPVVHYDGMWVAGLRADRWPPPAHPDPFIPVEAQRAAGVPAASAGGQLALARVHVASWLGASDELVVSAPIADQEGEEAASALLAELPGVQPYPEDTLTASVPQALFAARAYEELHDAEGQPWAADVLPAGTRTIEHQVRCPFRAYAQLRLGAEPLSTPRLGLDPRARGRLVHRALELLWGGLEDSSHLAALAGDRLESLIAECVESASAELATGVGADRERALHREGRRVRRLVATLCALDARRAPFAVIARELRRELELDGVRLRVRIDRVDRNEDGTLTLIDYKTSDPQLPNWLSTRPLHPQLLVYLVAAGGDVRALAAAHLASEGVAYRGMADRADRLPRVSAPGADPGAWERWRERWRGLVHAAVRDFVAGRALRDPARGACALCHLQALCRISDESGAG